MIKNHVCKLLDQYLCVTNECETSRYRLLDKETIQLANIIFIEFLENFMLVKCFFNVRCLLNILWLVHFLCFWYIKRFCSFYYLIGKLCKTLDFSNFYITLSHLLTKIYVFTVPPNVSLGPFPRW